MTQEEDVKIITRLGLTVLQAEVYLTLTNLEKATVKTISTTVKVDRANVYRVISKLQELGLVEKMITNPTVFKAIPIHDGLRMLLERQAKEHKEIETKTKELLKKRTENDKEKPLPEEGCGFALVPDESATIRKLLDMMNRSKESYDFIFYFKFLVQGIDDVTIFFMDLKAKGLSVRLVAYMNEGEKLHKKILSLEEKGKFEVRCTFESPPITLSLFDRKETLFNIASFNPTGTSSLWSNNPVLIAILQNYFDQKWHEAKEDRT
jgi:sugar-specific transcriptional regulator TrmB